MKIKSNLNLFILFFLTATLLCAISACDDEYESAPSKEDFFEVSENGCMGGCPNFTMRIQGDGAFTFQRHDVPDSVQIAGSLNPEEVSKLFKAIRSFGFEKYDASQISCKVAATDHSTIRMNLSMRGKMHPITHRLGCEVSNDNEELRRFEKEIYSILSIDKHISRGINH